MNQKKYNRRKFIRTTGIYGGMAVLTNFGIYGRESVTSTGKEFFIHVSPQGQDRWQGRLATPDRRGEEGPVLSLERARDLARLARQAEPARAVTVLLHPGVYRRSGPLILDATDSGTAGAPVTWRAAKDSVPVITGLKPLPSSWVSNGDGSWKMLMSDVSGFPVTFRQLFCNGQRLSRTRWPAQGYKSVYSFAGESEQEKKQSFRYLEGDVKRWSNFEDVEFVIFHSWSESRLFPKELDEKERRITFTRQAAYPFDFTGWNSYYVENVREALTDPGQWYHDRSEGVLYMRPPAGISDPNKAEFSVAVADALLELRGSESDPVRHIQFEGIHFTGTRWQMGPTGYANGGGAGGPHVRPAAITIENAEDCVLHNCLLEATAGYSLELSQCDRCVVSRTTIREAGSGGVILFGGADNEVADCHIHHCGRLYFGGTGVVNPTGLRTHIHHNHIHDMPYCGIRGGDNGKELNEIIEYNHIHHVMLVLDDGAGIFNAGIGSIIRNNLVHDCAGGRHKFAFGLYLDEYRTDVLLENNVVYNAGSELLLLHDNYGNTIVNNIFAFGGNAQLSWTVFHGTTFGRRMMTYRHPLQTFQRNIVYWHKGCLSHNLDCNRLDLASKPELIDYNIYWKEGKEDLEVPGLDRIPANEVRFGRGHVSQPGVGHDTFADWQGLGLDRHSLNQDPLFVDPDNGDFRLRENSPAFALGIKPIDVSGVGPRKI